jgi:hypothetical protein
MNVNHIHQPLGLESNNISNMGCLMYAILCIRSDLAYPISVMSQHMANPSLEHWIAIKHIF